MQNKPPKIKSKQSKNKFYLYDTAFFTDVRSEFFSGTYWQNKGAITGQETGRGTTFFLRHETHDLVLRHYLRGGLVSKISKDNYLFRHLKSCRSISEFDILNQLNALGLPVPKPAAAHVIRQGLSYKADLLTQRIPNAKDLVQVLKTAQNNAFFEQLGAMIALFHQQGVYHADLNIQNILQDSNRNFWLIDFDRAKIVKPSQTWRHANLKRLKRSFIKEKERYGIKWEITDWEMLVEAYQKAF